MITALTGIHICRRISSWVFLEYIQVAETSGRGSRDQRHSTREHREAPTSAGTPAQSTVLY